MKYVLLFCLFSLPMFAADLTYDHISEDLLSSYQLLFGEQAQEKWLAHQLNPRQTQPDVVQALREKRQNMPQSQLEDGISLRNLALRGMMIIYNWAPPESENLNARP